jgi:carbon monoxide dehydrogenase subunit G
MSTLPAGVVIDRNFEPVHRFGTGFRTGSAWNSGYRGRSRRRAEGGSAMTRLRQVVEVARTPSEAFRFLGDFANAEVWDPGTERSRRTDGGGPVRPGTTYDLVVRFKGRTMPMRYEVERYEAPRLVALRGEGDRVRARDEITFEPVAGGTRIIYVADLRLTGLARLATPLFSGTFRRLGEDAARGIREAFARGLDQKSGRRTG